MPDLQKRTVAILLPYRVKNGVMSVYLQKRSAEQKLPLYFGFWGGGVDGDETPEQALVRETREELGLDLDITTVKLFSRFEFLRSIKYVYSFVPPEGWEDGIIIGEGEYGKWFPMEEALALPNMIYQDKAVLVDFEREFLGTPIR